MRGNSGRLWFQVGRRGRIESQQSVTLVDGQRHRKDARHGKGQQIHQQRDKDNPDRRTRRRRGVFRLRHDPFGSGVGEWRPAAASFYAGVCESFELLEAYRPARVNGEFVVAPNLRD